MKELFYLAFENRFRGTRELIKQRVEFYLPLAKVLHEQLPKKQIIDLGCGRGEWLELLRDHGIVAKGIDLDKGMLSVAYGLGLDVQHADALKYLKSLSDNSASLISGFHIAEHLEFDTLAELVSEAYRVLDEGGVLFLETPNPENPYVSMSGFYMDPSHRNPIPIGLLNFLFEYTGFARSKPFRLNGGKYDKARDITPLYEMWEIVSPDYSIIGQKNSLEKNSTVEEFFAKDTGYSLHGVMQLFALREHERYNAHSSEIREARVEAQQARVEAQQWHQQAVALRQSRSFKFGFYILHPWKIPGAIWSSGKKLIKK